MLSFHVRPLPGARLWATFLVAASLVSIRPVAATPAPSVSNLRVAGDWRDYTALAGGRLAFGVPEADNGHGDLNGDGDVADIVVHVWDPTLGTTMNLGLALSGQYGRDLLVALDGGRLALGVSESVQGGTDLNGDGDANDTVVHVWDPGMGTTNLRLAVVTVRVCCYTDQYILVAVDGGGVAFSVAEAGQGNVDRNGDRDTNDSVVHVWSPEAGTVTNLGMASSSFVPLNGGGLALLVAEASQRRTDLNADGDAKDKVVHVWYPSTSPANLKLAAAALVPLDDGGLAVLVGEASQGASDLNGDGDAYDTVVHIWDPASPTTARNLRLAGNRVTVRSVVAVDGGRLGFRVYEADQGADLNGDGDRSDKVVHIWDPATATASNLRQTGADLVAVEGGRLAFKGSRGLQVWEPSTRTTTSVGLRNNGIIQPLPGGRVVFGVAEWAAKKDLNGDGDANDYYVLHIWDPATRRTTNLRLVGEGVALASGGFAFGVSEPSQGFDAAGNGNGDDPGADLTGDGDGGDNALHFWDAATKATTNLRMAGIPVTGLGGTSFAFLVPEAQQGNTDLNGDGDAADMVVHIAVT